MNTIFGAFSGIQSSYDTYQKAQAWPTISAVCLVLALIGAFVLFFTFLSARNDGKFTGFAGWLYEFLNFRKLLLEAILRIIYMVLAVYLVLVGVIYIFAGMGNFGQNLLMGLAIAIFGNVLLRLSYEFVMLLVSICKNVSDINRKLGGGKNSNQPTPPVNPFTSFSNQNRPQPPVTPPAQNFVPQQPQVRPGTPVQTPVAPQAQNPAPQQPSVRPGAPIPNATVPLNPAQAPVAPQAPVASQNPAQAPTAPQTPVAPQNPVQAPAAPMVFCRNCGKQFSAESDACPHCGTLRRK